MSMLTAAPAGLTPAEADAQEREAWRRIADAYEVALHELDAHHPERSRFTAVWKDCRTAAGMAPTPPASTGWALEGEVLMGAACDLRARAGRLARSDTRDRMLSSADHWATAAQLRGAVS